MSASRCEISANNGRSPGACRQGHPGTMSRGGTITSVSISTASNMHVMSRQPNPREHTTRRGPFTQRIPAAPPPHPCPRRRCLHAPTPTPMLPCPCSHIPNVPYTPSFMDGYPTPSRLSCLTGWADGNNPPTPTCAQHSTNRPAKAGGSHSGSGGRAPAIMTRCRMAPGARPRQGRSPVASSQTATGSGRVAEPAGRERANEACASVGNRYEAM